MHFKIEFDQNDQAEKVLEKIAQEEYSGKVYARNVHPKTGRKVLFVEIPGDLAIGSMPGEFCRRACTYLDTLNLNPTFGLADT